MSSLTRGLVSIIVPVYNEAEGLESFHHNLLKAIASIDGSFEIIYVDDGSADHSAELIRAWHKKDQSVKLVSLSRNFGKENALTAGLAVAKGAAVLTLDSDGQHPVNLIPQFIKAWQSGSKVVVGVRTNPTSHNWMRQIGAWVFYVLFNRLTGSRLIPGSSDYRLLDRQVVNAFLRLGESDRMTRLLVDWLGFAPHYIHFTAPERLHGQPTYSQRKLANLAMHSIVSASPAPLYWFGYLGVGITVASLTLGVVVFIEQLLLGDPLHWKFTGTAMLSILLLFLVGLVLLSQGLLSLYVSSIHTQSKQRPLYIIDEEKSAGIEHSS